MAEREREARHTEELLNLLADSDEAKADKGGDANTKDGVPIALLVSTHSCFDSHTELTSKAILEQ